MPIKLSTYCGSAHCNKKHRWIYVGTKFKRLNAVNCGAGPVRTPEELEAADRKITVYEPSDDYDRPNVHRRYPRIGEVDALDKAYLEELNIREWNAKFVTPPVSTAHWNQSDWDKWHESKKPMPPFDEWVKTFDVSLITS